jgi:hypothetical protein
MKVKYGAIVTEGRGKIGGHVATRNRYANVFRTKTSPCQPASSYQQLVKARMIAAAQAWRAFSDTVRAGFEALADQVSATNVFGDSIKYTGFALFCRLARELSEIGGSALTAAPAIPAMSSILSLALTAETGPVLLSLAYTPTPVPTGFTMVVQAAPQVSQGIAFIGGKYRTLATVAAASASPYVATTTYPARFGDPVNGNKIFFRAKLVHTASGFASGWMQCSDIVEAHA